MKHSQKHSQKSFLHFTGWMKQGISLGILLTFTVQLLPLRAIADGSADGSSATPIPPPAPSPSSMAADCGAAENLCKSFSVSDGEDGAKAAQVKTSCGEAPAAGAMNDNIKNDNNQLFTTQAGGVTAYESCKTTIESRFTTYRQYCLAMRLYHDAQELSMGALIAYTLALTACTAAIPMACADKGLFGLGLGAAQIAAGLCTAAGAAGMAVEMANMIKLSKDGEADINKWANEDANNSKNTWTDNNGTMRENGLGSTSTITGLAGAIAAVIALFSARATAKGVENLATKLANPCQATITASVLFLATTVIMGVNFGLNKKGYEDSCGPIQRLEGFGNVNTAATISGGNGAASISGEIKAPDTKTPAQAAADPSGAKSATIDGNVPHGAVSAASVGDGPMGDSLKKGMPDLFKPNPQLSNLANNIGKALASGQSPASIAGGIVPEAAGALNSLDKVLQNSIAKGDLSLAPGAFSSIYTGGGGGAKSAKAGAAGGPDFKTWTFGGAGGAAAAKAKASEMQFRGLASNKVSTAVLDKNTDIWHADWHGSIFDIASYKLKQDVDRLQKFEWVTPLNRALMGLPNQPMPVHH